MSDETKVTYKIVTLSGTEPGSVIQLPVEINKKGLKRFTIDLDEMELDGSGSKDKDGKLVQYMTFKIVK